jgi:hypothetical protein
MVRDRGKLRARSHSATSTMHTTVKPRDMFQTKALCGWAVGSRMTGIGVRREYRTSALCTENGRQGQN